MSRKWKLLPVALVIVWLFLHLVLRSRTREETIVISHRGYGSHAPENTLIAVEQALAAGSAYIEVDLRRSADGVLVLMHDQSVDRTTDGTGGVGSLSRDELETLDAGSHFSTEFEGEPIPTLDAVLDLIEKSSSNLVLEAKQPSQYPGIASEIAAKLGERNLAKQVVVVSFDRKWVDAFSWANSDVSVGYLCFYPPLNAPEGRIIYTYWSSVIVDPTLIWRLHRQGHPVWVWTVNASWVKRIVTWIGVDGFVSDFPNKPY